MNKHTRSGYSPIKQAKAPARQMTQPNGGNALMPGSLPRQTAPPAEGKAAMPLSVSEQVRSEQAPGCAKCLDDMPLGICCVPVQQWSTPYELEKALSRGTLFAELDLPFTGRRS